MKWLLATVLVLGCADTRSPSAALSGAGAASEPPPVANTPPPQQPVEKPVRAEPPDENLRPPPVADPPRQICDGSTTVRVFLNSVSGGGLVRPGTQVTLGRYVIITGECRFWVMLDTREEARTGTLSRDAGERLASDLHYAAWYRISDAEQGRITAIEGGGGWVLSDGSRQFHCQGFCTDALAREMFERASRLPEELYSLGGPVIGPMRVSAVANSSRHAAEQDGMIDWPLSARLERFVYDPFAMPAPGPNRGVLLEDPADLQILRALRQSLRASDYGYIPVRAELDAADGGSDVSAYDFYFRDVIPFEDPATGELRPF